MSRRRIGILSSHPIQYQAPWFRGLAQVAEVSVFFAHRQSAAEQGRAGFGVAFDWDVDLLSGYRHQFLENVAPRPDVSSFAGCDTPGIGEQIARGKFEAFIVNGWYLKSYLQAVAACRSARIPVLVRGDSQLATPRMWLKRLLMEVRQRWLLARFDAFLSVGARHREYLQNFGVPPSKIFAVPHFVDNEWFAARAAAAAGQRDSLRRQWGAGPEELVALFVGKFLPKKRPGDLLEALAGLKRAPGRVVGVFIGAGELDAELRARAAREDLPAHFAGFKNQSELPACYAAADVLVLPSDGGETWGLVVNEAMACGCPAVVSAAVGCGPDLIEAGRTGLSFPLGDGAALGAALRQMQEWKSAGRQFAEALRVKLQDYNLEVAVRGTLRGVEAVLAR